MYTTIQSLWSVQFFVFEWSLLCSPTLHLFDLFYEIILWIYCYNLNNCFSVLIYLKHLTQSWIFSIILQSSVSHDPQKSFEYADLQLKKKISLLSMLKTVLCCLVLWKPWIFRFSESSDFWKVPKWIVVVCKILHLAFSVSRRKCWFKKCFFFFVCVDWSKHCPPHYTEEGIWGVVTALTGCSPWVLYIFCFAFLNASWALHPAFGAALPGEWHDDVL